MIVLSLSLDVSVPGTVRTEHHPRIPFRDGLGAANQRLARVRAALVDVLSWASSAARRRRSDPSKSLSTRTNGNSCWQALPRRFDPERCRSTSDALMEPQERRTEYRIMRRVGDGCATWRNPAPLKVPASPMLANAGG